MRQVEAWRSAHPMGYSLISLLIFLITGAVVSVALGSGVPWFGLAVAAVVWALVSFAAGRGGRSSSNAD